MGSIPLKAVSWGPGSEHRAAEAQLGAEFWHRKALRHLRGLCRGPAFLAGSQPSGSVAFSPSV